MKKIIFAVFVLLPSLLFSQNVLDYFPIKVNAFWVYDLYPREKGYKQAEKTVTTGQITWMDTAHFVGFTTNLKGVGTTAEYDEQDKIDGPILQNMTVNIMGYSHTNSDPLPRILDLPGKSWTINSDGETDNYTTESGSIKFDNLSFPDCIKVTETSTLDDGEVIVETKYYALNIGLVLDSILKNGKTTEWRLKSSTFLN